MDKNVFEMNNIDIAWCPGCGNFSIRETMMRVLSELEISPENMVMVSGIGQAAKIPHYIKTNIFNGLHGRALPPATAIKTSNRNLTVIAESGDGDMYGEGGNHLIHAIRRNPNITCIIHNNMVYGLTKGQASPTSRTGFKTPVQVNGVILKSLNPIALAISQDASFVARTYSGDRDESVEIIKKAIEHRGFSLVDMLHPCVTFNKLNTRNWFKENTYYLSNDYDRANRELAFKKSIQIDKLALGIFYLNEDKEIFEEEIDAYRKFSEPLFRREVNYNKLEKLLDSKRR